ncbi:glutamate--tRNA ligase [Microlunatus ginsengisoli]|uniref:Glutamate--tRNA ligase n=1 Tax=Microlunatus ginsengisoli TaxID=363863 RepID=A0ABP7AX40_9ACTN
MNEEDVLGGIAPEQVRVRFPPSPTGNLHVGNVRSALFNWVFARHYGGTFVLRIEDTDAARNLDAAYDVVYDSLNWLGLTWDEGPGVGGPYGPYLQTERLDTYAEIVPKLLDAGHAYRCFCTREEIEAREAARPQGAPSGYDGFCRDLPAETVAEKQAAGTPFVVRMRVGEDPITFADLVRGEVTFEPAHVPDFVIVRSNGEPLYTLVNPVDDSLMKITHVLRGEDLLPSTPRQIVVYRALNALGMGDGSIPIFGHLPTVLGEGNRRLSKRDKGSGLAEYMERGYLPQGLLNYLALLGWAIADDRDVFTLDEMVDAFDIRRVNANPARFDPKKCEAINASHIRSISADELTERLVPFFVAAGLVSDPPLPDEAAKLAAATPLVQERIQTLSEAVDMLAFLFVTDEKLTVDPAVAPGADAAPVLSAAADALAQVEPFAHTEIEAALRQALIADLGLKPKFAFSPVRAAVTGKRISPPLFESLELLGRTSALARIAAAAASIDGAAVRGDA